MEVEVGMQVGKEGEIVVESPATSSIKVGPPFHFKVLNHHQADVLVR
jgi:hypothetical protein